MKCMLDSYYCYETLQKTRKNHFFLFFTIFDIVEWHDDQNICETNEDLSYFKTQRDFFMVQANINWIY